MNLIQASDEDIEFLRLQLVNLGRRLHFDVPVCDIIGLSVFEEYSEITNLSDEWGIQPFTLGGFALALTRDPVNDHLNWVNALLWDVLIVNLIGRNKKGVSWVLKVKEGTIDQIRHTIEREFHLDPRYVSEVFDILYMAQLFKVTDMITLDVRDQAVWANK